MRLLVVVASSTGRTRRMAEAAAEGARSAGAEVVVQRAEDTAPEDLVAADALLLGCGVHMGGLPSAMAAFFERMAGLWMQGALIGRIGGAFVSAGEGGRGGGELALVRLHAFLAENGILSVPLHNRLEGFRRAGSHWGPLVHTNPAGGEPGPTEAQLAASRAHGRFVAECALRWQAGAGVAGGSPSASARR